MKITKALALRNIKKYNDSLCQKFYEYGLQSGSIDTKIVREFSRSVANEIEAVYESIEQGSLRGLTVVVHQVATPICVSGDSFVKELKKHFTDEGWKVTSTILSKHRHLPCSKLLIINIS